jgi:hypothetical protein
VAKPSVDHIPPGGFVSQEVPMDSFFYILEFVGAFDGAPELGVAALIAVLTIGVFLVACLVGLASRLYEIAR